MSGEAAKAPRFAGAPGDHPELDVIVIGGGLIGCTIAWRLAQRGQQVVLVEKSQPARAATWAAAGWLSVLGESRYHPRFQELAQRSRDLYPDFVQELAAASGLAIEFGVPGKKDVSQAPPLWHADDAFVDNRQLGAAAANAAQRAGVTLLTGTPVTTLLPNAVKLADGRELKAAHIVVAAGAWSAQLRGLPRPLPVEPVKGQMLSLRAREPLPHILVSHDCYLIPRSGNRVLVGATIEHVGFTEGNTPEGLAGLRAAAQRLVPALETAEVLEQWYGFRPGTADQLPILGPDPSDSTLVYATGHYRNGILLAPITAQIISALIAAGAHDAAFEHFGIQRFGTGDRIHPMCDLCGAAMEEWHCRVICTACGYQRDCSDP